VREYYVNDAGAQMPPSAAPCWRAIGLCTARTSHFLRRLPRGLRHRSRRVRLKRSVNGGALDDADGSAVQEIRALGRGAHALAHSRRPPSSTSASTCSRASVSCGEAECVRSAIEELRAAPGSTSRTVALWVRIQPSVTTRTGALVKSDGELRIFAERRRRSPCKVFARLRFGRRRLGRDHHGYVKRVEGLLPLWAKAGSTSVSSWCRSST